MARINGGVLINEINNSETIQNGIHKNNLSLCLEETKEEVSSIISSSEELNNNIINQDLEGCVNKLFLEQINKGDQLSIDELTNALKNDKAYLTIQLIKNEVIDRINKYIDGDFNIKDFLHKIAPKLISHLGISEEIDSHIKDVFQKGLTEDIQNSEEEYLSLLDLMSCTEENKKWATSILENTSKDYILSYKSSTKIRIKFKLLTGYDKDKLKKALFSISDDSYGVGIVHSILDSGVFGIEDKELGKKIIEHKIADYTFLNNHILKVVEVFGIGEDDKSWGLELTKENLESDIKCKIPFEFLNKIGISIDDKEWIDSILNKKAQYKVYYYSDNLKNIGIPLIEKFGLGAEYKDILKDYIDDTYFDRFLDNNDASLLNVIPFDNSDKEWYKNVLENISDLILSNFLIPEVLNSLCFDKNDNEWAFSFISKNLNILIREKKLGLFMDSLDLSNENKPAIKNMIEAYFSNMPFHWRFPEEILDRVGFGNEDKDWIKNIVEQMSDRFEQSSKLVTGLLKKVDLSDEKEWGKELLNEYGTGFIGLELINSLKLNTEEDIDWKKSYFTEEISDGLKLNFDNITNLLGVCNFQEEEKAWFKETILSLTKRNLSRLFDMGYGIQVLEKVGIGIDDKDFGKELLLDNNLLYREEYIEFFNINLNEDKEWINEALTKVMNSEDDGLHFAHFKVFKDFGFWDKLPSDIQDNIIKKLRRVSGLKSENIDFLLEKSNYEDILLDTILGDKEVLSEFYDNLDSYLPSSSGKINLLDNNKLNKLSKLSLELQKFAISNYKLSDEDLEFLSYINDNFEKNSLIKLFDDANKSRQLFKDKYEELISFYKEKNYFELWKFKATKLYGERELGHLNKLGEFFGYEAIFKYLKNGTRDPHDAFEKTNYLIAIAKNLIVDNKMTKQQFIDVVLKVTGDRTKGYMQLNEFLTIYKNNWISELENELEDENGLKDPKFLDLANYILSIEKSGEFYNHIDNILKIKDVLLILSKRESLNKLRDLLEYDDEFSQAKYDFYSDAIYHPRSNPEMMMLMYENPEKFLGLDDGHANEEFHAIKKPSNMVTNFPYLNFDAEDLVDSMIAGSYDDLSYFKPQNIKFYVNKNKEVFSLDDIKAQLIEILSKNKKLFPQTLEWLRNNGIESATWKNYGNNKGGIVEFIFEIGFEKYIEGFKDREALNSLTNLDFFEAEIASKMDPGNFYNGFNCDKLAMDGGKKIVSMFNPMCVDFCVYKGGKKREVDNLKVTSWVTLNRKIGKNFKALKEELYSQQNSNISSLIGENFMEYKDSDEYVITMDNIEADPNFAEGNNEDIVRQIYEKFFTEYVKNNPLSPAGIPINSKKINSGNDYSKINFLTDTESNNYLPVYVNSYTDNSGEETLVGKLNGDNNQEKVIKTGIHPMNIEDVVTLSYLEDNIHPEGYKNHIGNLQHEITASLLNNDMYELDDYSMVYYDKEGKLIGYMLAYVGSGKNGEDCIYVSDIGVLEKSRGKAGLDMMREFINRYEQNGAGMPIIASARKDTSYALIKRYGDKKGLKLAYDSGSFSMSDKYENHNIVLIKEENFDNEINYGEYVFN